MQPYPNRNRGAILVMIVLLVFGMTACRQKEAEPPAQPAEPRPVVSFDEVRKQVGEALDVTKDFLFQESKKYQEDLKTTLAEIDRQIEAWRPHIEAAGEEARTRLEQELAEFEKKRIDVERKLKALEQPSKEAWDDMKFGLENALRELEYAVDTAANRFRQDRP